MRATLTHPLSVRLPPDIKKQFLNKCVKHGGQSEVLRILVTAYVENRLTVQPKEELK